LVNELEHDIHTADGTYWMSLSDFYKYLVEHTIGEQIDHYRNNYKLVDNQPHGTWASYDFQLTAGSQAFVGVGLYPMRMFRRDCLSSRLSGYY